MKKRLYKSKIDIIEKYSKEAPVNLVGIANDFGIAIHASNLGSQVAGVIKKDDKLGGSSGYVILVNQNDAPYRQRFTIAHELSHFILHKFFIGDGIQEDPLYRSGLSNTMERQANRLAANILMPLSLVKQLLKDYNCDITVIAKKLEVSKKALEILLSSNRLIQV